MLSPKLCAFLFLHVLCPSARGLSLSPRTLLSNSSNRLDSDLASSTAVCNLSLAVRIAESVDELEGSTSTDSVTGIGVTSGAVTRSGVSKGVET